MGDRQDRHAAPSGRHLAPGAGASLPRRTASRNGESEELERRDQEKEEKRVRRHGKKEEERAGRAEEKEDKRPARAEARRAADGSRAARPRRKWFKIFLLVYLAILGMCTGYLQIRLWLYLDRSQAEMDRAAAEQAEREAHEKALYQAPQLAFEQWRDGQTGEDWAELWSSRQTSSIDTQERVIAYFEELFAPDASQAYKDVSFTDESPVYLIKNGDQPLVRVTMTGQDLYWSVSQVEPLLGADKTVSVTVPASCAVSFNGIQLDEQFRQPADSLLLYEPVNEQLETPVTWVTYTAEGLLADPVITVTPPEGFETLQNDEGSYLITLPEGHVGDYPEQSVKFVRAFLNYYMNGYSNTRGNMNTVLGYLRKDTQAYQEILDTYESVNWASNYSNIDTSKTTAGNVIVWANNCFSVDVTYDADATMLGEAVDYANATMRLYYMKSDNGYYISHFETL